MPTLHWIGKDKVINHHTEVPFKILEHTYGFDNGAHTQTEIKKSGANHCSAFLHFIPFRA